MQDEARKLIEEKKRNKKWDGWKDCEKFFVLAFVIEPQDKRVYKQLTAYLKNGKPKTYNPKDFPEYLWRMDSPDSNICRFLVASMLHDIEQGERTAAECLKAIYRYSYPQEYNSLKRIRLMDASTLFSLTGFNPLEFDEEEPLDKDHLPSITDESLSSKWLSPPKSENREKKADKSASKFSVMGIARILTMLRVMGGDVDYAGTLNQAVFDTVTEFIQHMQQIITKHVQKAEEKQKIDSDKEIEDVDSRLLKRYNRYITLEDLSNQTRRFMKSCTNVFGVNMGLLLDEDTDEVFGPKGYANLFLQIQRKNKTEYSDTELSMMAVIAQMAAVYKKYQTLFTPKLANTLLELGNQTLGGDGKGEKGDQEGKTKEPAVQKAAETGREEEEKIEALQKKLDDLEKKYEADEQEIRHLNNELAEEKEKNKRAEEQICGMLDAEDPEVQEPTEKEETIDFDEIKGKKILVAGGHERWVRKMRQEYPLWDFALRNHENENDRFNVASYDMVVFNFEHISHSDYFILRNKIDGAAKNGVMIPVGYIRSTNIRQAGEAIWRLLLREKGGQDADRI